MDYEKKYKEALERARELYNKGNALIYADRGMCEVFPELAGSEDEKVRKEIIDYCHERLNTTYGALPNIETIKRWLAWLEKQKYTQRDVDDAYLKGVTDTKNILENRGKQTNFFENVSLTEFEEALADVCRGWIGEEIGWKDYIVKNANALLKICQKMWNEVQDSPFEQKPIDYRSIDPNFGIPVEDLMSKKNYADEVKPKFKAGDTIISSRNNVIKYLIKEVGIENELGELDYVVEDVSDSEFRGSIRRLSIKKVDEWAVLCEEQKPAWSEDDSKMFNICCDYLDVEKCVWLKSLKDRLKGGK